MKRFFNARQAAFTLIELLVVIAIIGILAAALFPAVSGAILRAQATAFTNRGRNIVMAVISANLEREKDMLGVLWPHNQGGDPNYPRVAEASNPVEWFRNIQNPPSGNPRLEGVDPSMLAGAGVPAAASFQALGPQNLAWGLVFNLLESDSENALFMVTKNLRLEFEQVSEDGRNFTHFVANSVMNVDNQRVPFGDKMIVTVRKGGSANSIRPDLLAEAVLEEERDDVLMPRGALNERAELLYPE